MAAIGGGVEGHGHVGVGGEAVLVLVQLSGEAHVADFEDVALQVTQGEGAVRVRIAARGVGVRLRRAVTATVVVVIVIVVIVVGGVLVGIGAQDVVWFDVSVDDSLGMEMGDALGDLDRQKNHG